MAIINGSNFNDNNTINGTPSILRPALSGGADSDILNGNGGNDILNGNGSNDILNGGADNDVLNGGDDRDILNGNSGSDILDGGTASDILDGGAASDTLIGGASGGDTFIGSGGNDSIDGGNGFDTVNYGAISQSITLSGVGTVRKTGGLGQDTLLRVENIIANSNLANNTIDASESVAGVSITVNLETRSLVANNLPVLGILPFTVVDFDDVIGTNANDTIVGDEQNNQLSGGNGNDTIKGGDGTDRLTGGAGNDIFDFDLVLENQAGASSSDVITDFVGNGNNASLGDQIDLSTIDANPFLEGNQAFTFVGTAAFFAVGQVSYVAGILAANTDFDFGADFEIQLTGAPTLFVAAGNPTSDIIL